MQCPTPISIRDKSDANPYGKASKRLTVPCGRCGNCRRARRNQWAFRLQQELKDSENAYFITLTYSDERLPQFVNNETGEVKSNLRKTDLQKFIKRLREQQYRQTKQRKFRYYAVGEYGTETDRAHYHFIGFNIDRIIIDQLDKLWGHGHTHIGTVNEGSILYVAKYHVNRNMGQEEEKGQIGYYDKKELKIEEGIRQKEFATMSKRPAIGHGYIKRNYNWHIENMNSYVIQNGYKKAIPRYYKDKIFTELNKETLSNKTEKQLEEIYDKQNEEAKRMGIHDVDRRIFDNLMVEASRYKQKTNKKNLF
jgi:hypothetical protein